MCLPQTVEPAPRGEPLGQDVRQEPSEGREESVESGPSTPSGQREDSLASGASAPPPWVTDSAEELEALAKLRPRADPRLGPSAG